MARIVHWRRHPGPLFLHFHVSLTIRLLWYVGSPDPVLCTFWRVPTFFKDALANKTPRKSIKKLICKFKLNTKSHAYLKDSRICWISLSNLLERSSQAANRASVLSLIDASRSKGECAADSLSLKSQYLLAATEARWLKQVTVDQWKLRSSRCSGEVWNGWRSRVPRNISEGI